MSLPGNHAMGQGYVKPGPECHPSRESVLDVAQCMGDPLFSGTQNYQAGPGFHYAVNCRQQKIESFLLVKAADNTQKGLFP